MEVAKMKEKSWPKILRDAIYSGAVSSAATAATAAVCGQIEKRNAVAPINAISHIAWGEESFEQSAPSLKYTVTGLALNDSAHYSWAVLFEALFGEKAEQGNVPHALMGGAVVSAIAYLTDYHVVPKRFTPGFEAHLSSRSLLVVYIVLALSLAAGGLTKRRWWK
jgi:hypothetical protein